jgi:hypothetical protein
VVLGQPVDVVIERVHAGGRHDPGLPHGAAELVLEASRPHHALRRARDDRAERAAEPLREADRDRLRVSGDRRRLHPARNRGVEQPRAVQVQTQVELAAGLGHRLDLSERPDAASRGVVRVLDRHDACRRHMAEVAPPRSRAHLVRGETPRDGRKRPRHQPRMHRRAAELGNEDVRQLLGDQLVAGLAEHAQRDLVRHRRGRHEDRVLVAQDLGRPPLELVDGRVLPDLLVTDLGVRHRLAHRLRRLRRRIGAEIDHRQLPAVVGYRSVTTSK